MFCFQFRHSASVSASVKFHIRSIIDSCSGQILIRSLQKLNVKCICSNYIIIIFNRARILIVHKSSFHWLKYQSLGSSRIGAVMILPRDSPYLSRILNTAVSVYANDNSVQHCGTITELQSGDWPNYQSYYVNCAGVNGDMVHLTDLDITASWGLNIAEVAIYGHGPWPTAGR